MTAAQVDEPPVGSGPDEPLPPGTPVDRTNCAREQIHLTAAVLVAHAAFQVRKQRRDDARKDLRSLLVQRLMGRGGVVRHGREW